MNAALVGRWARDYAWIFALVVFAVTGFEILVVGVVESFAESLLKFWREVPLLRNLLLTLTGLDASGPVTAASLVSLGLVAPFVILVTWAWLITVATSVPAGEVDRGTADLLLSLPVSRTVVYGSISVLCLASGVVMALAAWAGVALGVRIYGTPEPVNLWLLRLTAVNMMALYVAVSGLGLMLSALHARRATAIGIVLGTLAISFLLNFLEAFLPSMKYVRFLGFLHYYQPVNVVRAEQWPVRDLAVLLGAGAVFWSIGLAAFRRKDIPAT